MNHPANCPHCDYLLDGGDVYKVMLDHHKGDEAVALGCAAMYGWSPETPKRFSKIVGCYDMDLDKTTHFICPKCRKEIK